MGEPCRPLIVDMGDPVGDLPNEALSLGRGDLLGPGGRDATVAPEVGDTSGRIEFLDGDFEGPEVGKVQYCAFAKCEIVIGDIWRNV